MNLKLYVGQMPESLRQFGEYYGTLMSEHVVYPLRQVYGNSEEEVREKLQAHAERYLKAREVLRTNGPEALADFLKQR